MSLYPQINVMGSFKLKVPFQGVIQEDKSYTVISVRRFNDIRQQGIDPYNAYYVPKGIALSTFQDDESNKAAIVTLQGGNGEIVFIPSTYILEFPSLDGFPYAVMGLSVKIGSMFTEADLVPLITAVKQTIQAYTGYANATVAPVALSAIEYIDSAAHQAIETNRLTSVTVSATPAAELTRLRLEKAQLLDKVAELEQYIIANP